MDHVFYSDGNANRISWIIQTDDSIIEQSREHIDIYKNKIPKLQSKYVALHIGLFWGIGVFKIKNEDKVKIKLDEKTMFEQLSTGLKLKDELYQIIAKHSGQTVEKVHDDSDRDYWMKADEAKKYGMIDEVLTRDK